MGSAFRIVRVGVSILLGALFGLVLAAGIVAVIATGFFHYHVVTVVSTSMQPDLKKGDIAVVKPVTVSTLKTGDVIMFSQNGLPPTIHRIIAVNTVDQNVFDKPGGKVIKTFRRYFYETKGDANPSPDASSVPDTAVMGQLMFSVPTFGLLKNGTNPHTLLIGLAIGVALLWAAWELGAFALRRRRPKAPKPSRSPNADPSPDDDWSPESGLSASAQDSSTRPNASPRNAPPGARNPGPESRT